MLGEMDLWAGEQWFLVDLTKLSWGCLTTDMLFNKEKRNLWENKEYQ